MRKILNKALRKTGYRLEATGARTSRDAMEPEFLAIWRKCAPYTMSSVDRAYGLYLATRYIASAGLPGDFIECGVWKGGSSMVMAHALLMFGETRPLYLYDTFEGMSEPTEFDVASRTGQAAASIWEQRRRGAGSAWCDATLEEVRANLLRTDYPRESIHLIRGKVEDTLPRSNHDQIAMLRLDTDWYESTKVEMELLYPRLVRGGVLILDDYGHWEGARKAVDDYLGASETHLLLSPLDYTGRLAVKS